MLNDDLDRERQENRSIIASLYRVKLSINTKQKEPSKPPDTINFKDDIDYYLMPDNSLLGGEPYREKQIYSSGIDKIIGKSLAFYLDYYLFSLPGYYKERHLHYDFYNTLDKRYAVIKQETEDGGVKLNEQEVKDLIIKKIKNKITSKIISKTIQDVVIFPSVILAIGAYIPVILPIASMLSLAIVVLGPIGAFGSILYNRNKINKKYGTYNSSEKTSFVKDLASAFKKGKILRIIASKVNAKLKIPIISVFFPQLMSLSLAIYYEFVDNSGFRALSNKRALWLGACCNTFAKLSFMPIITTAELKESSDKKNIIIRKLKKELKDAKVASDLQSIEEYFKKKTGTKIYNKFQRAYAATYFKAISIITAILLIVTPISPAYIAIGSGVIQFASWGFSFLYASLQKSKIKDAVDHVFKIDDVVKKQLGFVKDKVFKSQENTIFISNISNDFSFVKRALSFAESEKKNGKDIKLIFSTEDESTLIGLLKKAYEENNNIAVATLKINGEELKQDAFDRIMEKVKPGRPTP
jgi:hypothetical protein